jgi:hypothetical protein
MDRVEIHIRGRLDDNWSDWMGGLTISYPARDETMLCGALPDQPALYSVLARLHDLNLTLISVRCVPEPAQGADGITELH